MQDRLAVRALVERLDEVLEVVELRMDLLQVLEHVLELRARHDIIPTQDVEEFVRRTSPVRDDDLLDAPPERRRRRHGLVAGAALVVGARAAVLRVALEGVRGDRRREGVALLLGRLPNLAVDLSL